MNAYLDTSVLLRLLLGDPSGWPEYRTVKRAYSSELLPIEVGRTIDRLRLQGAIDDETVASLHEESARLLTRVSVVAFDERIRRVAAGPMPTIVGTLDALHLATALRLRDELEPALVLATHDRQLAIAARAHGVPVVAAW